MVGAERTAIFPLRVTRSIALADSDPAMLANGMPRLSVGLLKPRDDERRVWLKLTMRDVIVGQRTVDRGVPRHEGGRDVGSQRCRMRVVAAAGRARGGGGPGTLVS